ncbi:hypothetical protein H8356DRAFT_1656449 [Neocallimastix lanati (nom. inval.)]|jgi:hypothetical protein|nr:hypothetical protein H8356DRAFT_1656449 [Neocallimastix sp. JGI-2020a]
MNTTTTTSTTLLNEAPRFLLEHDTCFGKDGRGFIEGFLTEFKDSYRYTFLIQFILVSLLYFNVGKGVYWKVLFYASTAGLLGSIFENITVSYVCRDSLKTENQSVFFLFFLVNEIFWITTEYAIPYLNLIKMKAFARGKLAVIIRFTIIGLFIPFVLFRFLIGYRRMKKGYLQDFEIQTYHGYAFGVMAVADLICTFSILYFVRQNNLRAISNLNDYIKHSSYTILVGVDIVSTLLSVLSIINAITLNSSPILKSLTIPLYCFKSSFVLILAIDAFLFKYGANVTSINESRSSNNNSKNYVVNSNSTGYKSYKNLELNNKINNKSLNSSYSIDMTNINTNNSRNNVPQYKANLQALEKAKTDAPIVKNYTNLPTNQAAFLFDTNTKASSQMEVNAYSKTFGYHY